MSLYDLAKDALKEIPMSDIMRARLELAVDQATSLERKVSDMQTEIGRLQAQLENANAEKKKQEEDLRVLREAMKEEVVIEQGIEFRRGQRTRGEWLPFCPKCHLPTSAIGLASFVGCSDKDCGYSTRVAETSLPMIIGHLNEEG